MIVANHLTLNFFFFFWAYPHGLYFYFHFHFPSLFNKKKTKKKKIREKKIVTSYWLALQPNKASVSKPRGVSSPQEKETIS